MDKNNFWKRVEAGDVSNNPYFKVEPVADRGSEDTSVHNVPNHNTPSGRYEITDYFNTYALGVDHIRSISITPNNTQPIFVKPDGSNIYRPLTMLESLEVMVNDYNTLKDASGQDRTSEDRKKLLSNYKFTCTGIAYKAGGKEIKIIPQSTELITIPSTHNSAFLPITYNNIIGTILNPANAKYNQLLSETEVNNHPAWIASVGDTKQGRNILKEYTSMIFKILSEKQQTTAMGFYTNQNPTTDELRALYVRVIGSNSFANGSYDLNYYARFLLVAPQKKF